MVLLYYININIFLFFYSNAWQHHYNLYNTDMMNSDFSHDCMYVTIDDLGEIEKKVYRVQQINEYCIRPSLGEQSNAVNGSIFSISTFDQLKKENVTAEDLIKWSSLIDLAERYQNFLQMNNTSSMELFYNCTIPWFGPFCQYRYSFNRSFSDIVDIIFRSKTLDRTYSNFTCYMHMKCDRGSSLICLDWREICDGKIDCLNGGEDEKHCLELQMNHCDENEYQCRNGMCINEVFFLDRYEFEGNSPPECLDGSDEVPLKGASSQLECVSDPRFRCEDIGCTIPNCFTCSDGGYYPWPMPSSSTHCYSKRDQVFNYNMQWYNQEAIQFSRCFKIAVCAKETQDLSVKDIYCKSLCENKEECKRQIIQDCPSAFVASDFPVWDGHVRLGYFSNQTMIMNSTGITPHFVCFDTHKCPFLNPTFQMDNYTCVHSHKLNFSDVRNFYGMFLSYTDLHQSKNKTHCPETSMLRCPGTNQCIPPRHIMNGIPDCYEAFDESSAANSCALNNKYRFNCTSENKCILRTMESDGIKQCIGGEDEVVLFGNRTHINELPFSALCDSYQDIFFSMNETDETHCEQWQCVNQYTRCNEVWNCPKGIDELNCPSNFHCPNDYHPCIDPKNQTMGCLHVNHTEDGIMDCLGATDERALCRLLYLNRTFNRYQCWNDTVCVNVPDRCLKCKKLNSIDEFCPEDENENDVRDIILYLESMYDVYLFKKLPFSPQSSRQFPAKQSVVAVSKLVQQSVVPIEGFTVNNHLDSRQAWLCNKGVLILVGKNETEQCLCPPTYYGHHCQYQNQRVSLTLRVRSEDLVKFTVIGIIITLVDHTGFVHSHEQITYTPTYDCNTKYNIYLFYRDRPKDMTKNYTVHIDAYDKVYLVFITSLTLPVKFLFMPVNRMSTLLIIPAQIDCDLLCSHRYHGQLRNIDMTSCRCKLNKYEMVSRTQHECNCSPDSICVGFVNNRSICLCPLTKMSPHCFLNSTCQINKCLNRGRCVPSVDRDSFSNFTCICQDGFSGKRCEKNDTKINISFSDVIIPQSFLVHFITVKEYKVQDNDPAPIRATMFKKVSFDEDTATLYMSLPFHLAFAQIESTFFLIVLQYNYTPSIIISTQIASSQRCPHTQELFDQQTNGYPIYRRVKYYHTPCSVHPDLVCFHDNNTFMCLCTEERHANCFHFDFNMSYDCMNWNDCQNGAQCFQDHPTCPTKRMCICQECFYGTKCQFTTKHFGLSLDAILGYHIRPHLSFTRQSVYVKISIAIATLMLIVTLVTGTLSILTFQMKPCQEVGCGRYLLVLSIISILTIIIFNLKLWFLILSQMSIIMSRSFLLFSCISIEFVLRSLIAITDWLHACVSVERILNVIFGARFNKAKSKKTAKLVIFGVFLFTIVSVLHDPVNRRLIDDEEEKRTWCLVRFTSSVEIYNSFINIFHFIIPFSIKVFSTFGIIVGMARKRASIQKHTTYSSHLTEQFHHHKHLLISSGLLIILALPRLIISFSFGCMKSARNPVIFLIGYFVSFIPPSLTFFIFIPNSEIYKKQFNAMISRKWKAIRRKS